MNCDVGEGLENENELLPLISSCNSACGGHAGDPQTIDRVIGIALRNGVKIGAHPSYPDRENFGRKTLDIGSNALIASIKSQMSLFTEILQKNGGTLHHIKPHGALYNDLAKNVSLSQTFLTAIEAYNKDVKLYVPYGSVIAEEAQKKGWELLYEAFGDRNYNDDLSLVSRKESNALIRDPHMVLEHILTIINKSKVNTLGGLLEPLVADTICLHGDTPEVLEILVYLSRELPNRDILIK